MGDILILVMAVGGIVVFADAINKVINWICRVFPKVANRIYSDIPECREIGSQGK